MILILVNSSRVITRHVCKNLYRNSSQSSAEYCMESVKKYDYENFVCSILLKNNVRACAFAIRSFNVELARVAEQASQETIAQMRLRFWEDTIEQCIGNNFKIVPKHPIAIELFKAHNVNKLSKRYLNNLISSRKHIYRLNSFNTIADVENYVDKSVSSVYYLILEGSGIKSVHADHAASHLGKAQGIVQQIRSIPVSSRINFVPIPQELLMKHNLSQESIIRARKSENLVECTFELASRAYQHLVKARSFIDCVPNEARAILLPSVPILIYLDRLQRVNYDVYHPTLQTRSWKLLPQLWLYNFKNKY